MSRLDGFFDSRWANAIGGFIIGGLLVALVKSSPSKPSEPVNVDVARADWVTVCLNKMAGGNFPKPQQLKDCTDAALILMPLTSPTPADSGKVASAPHRGEASVSNMGVAYPDLL